jgi:hypothetical protein
MAKGWKRPFDDPIVLPDGRSLVTLEDAGDYITRLPKAEQQLDEWQTAIEVAYDGRRESRAGDARAHCVKDSHWASASLRGTYDGKRKPNETE